MALFSRRVEDAAPVVSPQDEFLAEMPGRIAEIATAAQRAGDALRFHLDQMARQRAEPSEGEGGTAAPEAYEELARVLLERLRRARGDAKELATVLERSAWHLAALRSEERRDRHRDGDDPGDGHAAAPDASDSPVRSLLRRSAPEPPVQEPRA